MKLFIKMERLCFSLIGLKINYLNKSGQKFLLKVVKFFYRGR